MSLKDLLTYLLTCLFLSYKLIWSKRTGGQPADTDRPSFVPVTMTYAIKCMLAWRLLSRKAAENCVVVAAVFGAVHHNTGVIKQNCATTTPSSRVSAAAAAVAVADVVGRSRLMLIPHHIDNKPAVCRKTLEPFSAAPFWSISSRPF